MQYLKEASFKRAVSRRDRAFFKIRPDQYHRRLLIGYPLAFTFSQHGGTQQEFLYPLLFLLPMWMNFLIRTYALASLINEQGVVTKFFFQKLGLISGSITGTEGAIIIGMVYNFLPFLILPVYTSILKIDRGFLEAARDLGANTVSVFSKDRAAAYCRGGSFPGSRWCLSRVLRHLSSRSFE